MSRWSTYLLDEHGLARLILHIMPLMRVWLSAVYDEATAVRAQAAAGSLGPESARIVEFCTGIVNQPSRSNEHVSNIVQVATTFLAGEPDLDITPQRTVYDRFGAFYHDIRNPLSTITGHATLLQRMLIPADQRHIVQALVDYAQALHWLTSMPWMANSRPLEPCDLADANITAQKGQAVVWAKPYILNDLCKLYPTTPTLTRDGAHYHIHIPRVRSHRIGEQALYGLLLPYAALWHAGSGGRIRAHDDEIVVTYRAADA
jgi:hypothetical protein